MVTVCVVILENVGEGSKEKYYLAQVVSSLEKEGIEVLFHKNFFDEIEKWNLEEKKILKETILIADSQKNLEKSKKWGIPSIGFWMKEKKEDLASACVLLESFQGVDKEYLIWVQKRTFHEPVTIAVTKRLELRELKVEDMKELYQLYQKTSDKKFLENAEDTLWEMEEKQRAYIKNGYEFYNFGLWGIFLADNQTLIGYGGIQSSTIEKESVIELGYFIGDRYQKMGYGKEAVEAIFSYAKNQLEIKRIVAAIEIKNENSIKFAQSMGMVEEKKALIKGKELIIYEKRMSALEHKKNIRKKYYKKVDKNTTLFNKEKGSRTRKEVREAATQLVLEKALKDPDTSVYGKRYAKKKNKS